VETALKLFPCQILLVHRDAENRSRAERLQEIAGATENLTDSKLVSVIPVRMSEAWLLSDIAAIRRAANNPNGDEELEIPSRHQWETTPDPKARLFAALRKATGLNARRREKFDVYRARLRVAELTQEFSALRELEAFREFERELREALEAV
jgi:hypothetical protein